MNRGPANESVAVPRTDGVGIEPAPEAPLPILDSGPYFSLLGVPLEDGHIELEWSINKDTGLAELKTNLAQSVAHETPGAWSWGNKSASAHALAINILNALVPPFSDGFEPILVAGCLASRTAHELAPKFVDEVVAKLDGTKPTKIPSAEIQHWLTQNFQMLVDIASMSPMPKHFPAANLTPLDFDLAGAANGRGEAKTDHAQKRLAIDAEAISLALPAINQEIRSAFSSFARDLRAACRLDAQGKEDPINHFSRTFYWGLAELARTFHAIDVQLFRAEASGGLAPLGHMLAVIPEKLRAPVHQFLNLYWHLTNDCREMLQSGVVGRYINSALSPTAAGDTSAISIGGTVAIFCRSMDAFRQLYASVQPAGETAPERPLAFYASVVFEGRRIAFMAFPANQYNFTPDARGDIVHERQHSLTRLMQGAQEKFVGKSDINFENALSEVEAALWRDLRDELISFGIQGRYVDMGSYFGRGASYDYPSQSHAANYAYLSASYPEIGATDIEQGLQEVHTRFYSQSAALCSDLANVFAAHDGAILPYFQLLHFLDIRSWQTHLGRMQKCGLLGAQ